MLHILLLILKIIGIILAAILGILVLLITAVLFVPVRYRGAASGKGGLDSVKGAVQITWFLRLIRIKIQYADGKLSYALFIARRRAARKEKEKDYEDGERLNEGRRNKESAYEDGVWKNEKIPEKAEVQKIQEKDREDDEKISGFEKAVFERSKLSEESVQKMEKDAKSRRTDRTFQKDKGKGSAKNFIRKIKCTLKRFCDKIKTLEEKKDKLAGFIQDEKHQKAFGKLKREMIKLLRRIKPRKFFMRVHFGFEDPYTTGRVLAGLSVLYPFLGGHVEIIPDFEKKVFVGKIGVRGRIYAFHIAALLWNLVWSKDVRRTYRDLKGFQL